MKDTMMKRKGYWKKFLGILLLLYIVALFLPQNTIKVKAATADEAIGWVQSQVGRAIDNDGMFGAQCVDLIQAYYSYLGVTPASGNGVDYATNALPAGWTRIQGAVPQKGDILVYSGSTGNPLGHVAIFESTWVTYHQNFNNQQYVQKITNIAYNGFTNPYWGVIRPNFTIPQSCLNLGDSFTALILRTDIWKPIFNDGSNVTLQTEKNRAGEKWKFERQGNGSYIIQSLYDGKVLDVYGAGSADQTNVWTYERWDNDKTEQIAQRWYIYPAGSAYKLSPECAPGKCLDAAAGESDDGTNIQIYADNGTGAQIYSIYKIEEIGLSEITILADTTSLEPGKDIDLQCVFSPSNTSYNTVSWTSSDPAVATVDSNGKVHGVAFGSAVITCSNTFNPAIQDSIEIKVENPMSLTVNAQMYHKELDFNNGYNAEAGFSSGFGYEPHQIACSLDGDHEIEYAKFELIKNGERITEEGVIQDNKAYYSNLRGLTGEQTITAYVYDKSGNGGTTQITHYFDTTAPAIDNDSLKIEYLSDNQIKFSIKASDDGNIRQVTFDLIKYAIGDVDSSIDQNNCISVKASYSNGIYEGIYDGSHGELGKEYPVGLNVSVSDECANISQLEKEEHHSDYIYIIAPYFIAGDGRIKVTMEKGENQILKSEESSLYSQDWYTTAPDIVSVNKEGKITALKEGTAIIISIKADPDSNAYVEETYKVTVVGEKQIFSDVKDSDWFYSAVQYVTEKQIMSGLTTEIFGPDEQLTRSQFAAILYRIDGEPQIAYESKFLDVPEGQWFTKGILWANKVGIVSGYKDSQLFGTEDPITREQMVAMLYRYGDYKGYDISARGELDQFTDKESLSDYAKDAMRWAVKMEIISGKEGNLLDPQGSTTRGECAAIIMRFLEKYE